MATTTISYHPSTSLRALFGAFCAAVTGAFQRPAVTNAAVAEADGDVWKLYRMSRGRDSVSPAVINKLSRVAAAK